MRLKLDRAPKFALAFAVFAFAGASCALGQQSSTVAQKAPAAAANSGAVPSAAPTGKQAAKDAAPDPPSDPMAVKSAQLLKLATELKAEIDKTNRNVLSIAVIRKADEIERMAHGMKDKVRVDAASNSGEEQGGSQK